MRYIWLNNRCRRVTTFKEGQLQATLNPDIKVGTCRERELAALSTTGALVRGPMRLFATADFADTTGAAAPKDIVFMDCPFPIFDRVIVDDGGERSVGSFIYGPDDGADLQKRIIAEIRRLAKQGTTLMVCNFANPNLVLAYKSILADLDITKPRDYIYTYKSPGNDSSIYQLVIVPGRHVDMTAVPTTIRAIFDAVAGTENFHTPRMEFSAIATAVPTWTNDAVAATRSRQHVLGRREWGWWVEGGEAVAELVGRGGVDGEEDVQGRLPGGAGCRRAAAGVVGLTEVRQDGGFEVAGTGVAGQHEGLLIGIGGLVEVLQVVVGVADAVPGVGLGAVVVGVDESECASAVVQRLGVVAALGVTPADGVERGRLFAGVAGGLSTRQRVLGVVQRPFDLVSLVVQVGQGVVHHRLSDQVAGLLVQSQRLAEVGVGLGVAAEQQARVREPATGERLGSRVPQGGRGRQRDLPRGGEVRPVTLKLHVESAAQASCQAGVASPDSAARPSTASRLVRSTVNQARGSLNRSTPVSGGGSPSGSTLGRRKGLTSRSAATAVCR